MIFNGRSDRPREPARRQGRVLQERPARDGRRAALLHKTMTTYTDQPIPLADLGKMSRSGAGRARAQRDRTPEVADVAEAEPAEPKPDLALIDCVGDALAISRKVDPDRPVLLSLQRITGDRLIYDRRTGDFLVPAGGRYLYDGRTTTARRTTERAAAPGRPPIRPFRPPSDAAARQAAGAGKDTAPHA